MAQTYQTINTLAVVPSALMLYDFAITLDKEVEYIWKKSMSIVSLIYFMLRYFGTIFVLFYTGVLVRYWHAQGQANNYIFPVTQIWPQVVANWLVHVILQMRLYVLYNRSKKVIFVVVLGFVIEVASTLVTMIRISIFEANNLFNQKVSFTGFPATEAINIYINYAGVFLYECLLFFFALWAGIQCSRCPSVTRGIGARLRVILIQGNVVYFLVTLLYLLGWLIVSLVVPSEYALLLPSFGLSLSTIIGCQIILHIRSAASQLSTSPSTSQHNSTGQTYSLVVFHDPAHSLIYIVQ
ncbi:hypothetical protein J3A83DRAFT_1098554 [Scleroderma citrinum]